MARPGIAERRNGTAPAESPAGGAPALPTYWSANEFARELRVHRSTIYRLAAANPDLPQLHLGGGIIRFPVARTLAWLRRREGRPVA
jgi:predicted DNA-binding transcriptional regulator AlpA